MILYFYTMVEIQQIFLILELFSNTVEFNNKNSHKKLGWYFFIQGHAPDNFRPLTNCTRILWDVEEDDGKFLIECQKSLVIPTGGKARSKKKIIKS